MLRWFTDWLARLVELGIGLAAALIRGVLGAPGARPLDEPSEADPSPALEEQPHEERPPEE
ncbi:MAG: hypothetical protein KTR31_39215 [Myxococcales bacterium]|nr:hypothetical protein [Myxococcales bacterium]